MKQQSARNQQSSRKQQLAIVQVSILVNWFIQFMYCYTVYPTTHTHTQPTTIPTQVDTDTHIYTHTMPVYTITT